MRAVRRKASPKGLKDDTSGSVFVEAALVVPILCVILAGMTEWGLALYQYNLLSTATGSAVRQLIVSRGYDTPYDDVYAEYQNWAKTLGVKKTDIKVSVNGVECTDNATCKAQLDNALSKPATVKVSYACTMQFTPSVASPCPIEIVMTGMVE